MFFIFFSLNPIFGQSRVLINEVLLEPQPQQIELINLGTESANIINWTIDDDGGSASVYTITNQLTLEPNNCLVFSSNFYLNLRSSDSVRLFNDRNFIVNSFSYRAGPGVGISFQRLPDGENSWSTGSATLGLFNLLKTSCQRTATTPSPNLTPTPPQVLEIIPTDTPSPTPSFSFLIPSPQITLNLYQHQTATPTFSTEFFYNLIFISEAMVNQKSNEKE
ncbi:MAG: lamin tail domain-containing protein [Patescibacteria group bacterium]|nr:lamin tail domain-containing protein [Patescibacteria group bacterium]